MPKSPLDEICEPEDAAKTIGVSVARVKVFCQEGRLEARKMGRGWIITIRSVEAFAEQPRESGRPKQSKNRKASRERALAEQAD